MLSNIFLVLGYLANIALFILNYCYEKELEKCNQRITKRALELDRRERSLDERIQH